ncbi:hypothetical protein [Streptomyces sp. NPDC002559]
MSEEPRPAEAKRGPELTPGQPAPGLYEPGNTGARADRHLLTGTR